MDGGRRISERYEPYEPNELSERVAVTVFPPVLPKRWTAATA